ncbi:MAG: hypothetical protein R3252_05585 [Robiginitalea sp.]|nr:hypothetical protein [Robiginitalea sp.]
MLQSKFWQAFFALSPLVSLLLLFVGYGVFLFSILSNLPHGGEPDPSTVFGSLGVFLVIILLMVLLSLGSMVYYIVHAAYNPNLKENNLLLVWVLLFIFASGVGQLIYWIVEILTRRDEDLKTPV